MKTIPAALLNHYQSGATQLALLWKVIRKDGTTFGFTDHDVSIPFEGLVYESSSAFDASAVSSKAQLNVDNLQVQGLLTSEGITAADIEAGLWDGAEIQVRRVCWKDTSKGAEVLRVGELGEVERRGGLYLAELRGLAQRLQTLIGRVVAPSCDAQLGDARCGFSLAGSPTATLPGTILTTDGASMLQANLSAEDNWYTSGWLLMTSGAASGIGREVKLHQAGSPATVHTVLPFPLLLQPGDTFEITVGCDLQKSTCKTKFNNVINFRGFSFVPGQAKMVQVGKH